MNQTGNPLSKFYRTATLSVKLPSRGSFYDDGVVELNDELEVDVLPMTAQDELILQNPDALLNGEAVTKVISSCVPDVKAPKKLLSCDIDVLMIAIRVASYGDDATMEPSCPKCNETNSYTLNLDNLLNHAETLDQEYETVIDGSLTVFISPSKFENVMKQQKAIFHNTKLEQAIRDPDLSDEKRMKILSQVFDQMARLTFEQTLDAIKKVVFTSDDGELIEVTDKNHITEWLNNIDKQSVDTIQDKIAEVNSKGIEKTIPAKCVHCEYMWEATIEFNPVNFF
jgi:hypothetical protein